MCVTQWTEHFLEYLVSKLVSNEEFRISSAPISSAFDAGSLSTLLLKNLEYVLDEEATKDTASIGELLPNLASLTIISSTLTDISDGVNDKQIKKIIAIILYVLAVKMILNVTRI